ncbi:MAG: hypothetical protein ACRDVL_04670 [Acidimicrobiia bacterium]
MTTIGAGIASSAGMKLAAGGLAAALAAGGTALVSGHLDASVPADARVGSNLNVQEDAQVDLQTRTIEVAGFGTVEVAFSDSQLEVTRLDATAQGSALIRSQTQTSAVIDFTLDGAASTLFVSVVDGEIATSIVSDTSAGVAADINAEADAGADAEADARAASSSASGEADAEIGISTDVGIELGLGG